MTVEFSVVMWGLGTVVAIVSSHVRMETRLNDACKLLDEVRRAIGMSNGSDPKFVQTGECSARHSEIHRDIQRLESKVDAIIDSMTAS